MTDVGGDKAVVAEWLERAAEDLRVAELLWPFGVYNTVAYHCQQAAEKLMKGLLLDVGEMPRKTHELDALLDALRRRGLLLDPSLDDAVFGLTPFATVSRYPGWGHVLEQQAEQALLWARQVDRAVRLQVRL